MLDLDKFINNNVEMKINGECIHVNQPTVSMIDTVDRMTADVNEDNERELRVELALMYLNNNIESVIFEKKDLKQWPLEAVNKVISTITLLRYEAEENPN